MTRSTYLAPALALLFGLGCGGEEASGTTDRPGQVAAEPAAAALEAPRVEAEPTPRIEEATFELVATAAGPYTAGNPGTFEIRLAGRGDYHVNIDPLFPFSIALGGPDAVAFEEAALDRESAEEFTEERARFEVPFVPNAEGEHKVTATVDFAVCTATTCIPETRTLALVLPVQ